MFILKTFVVSVYIIAGIAVQNKDFFTRVVLSKEADWLSGLRSGLSTIRPGFDSRHLPFQRYVATGSN